MYSTNDRPPRLFECLDQSADSVLILSALVSLYITIQQSSVEDLHRVYLRQVRPPKERL